MRRFALLAALAALVACPAASAHGGGGRALGYTSTVKALSPATPGVRVEVLDSDDRLSLTVEGDATVVVLGYEDEPYLRVSPDGVYRNVRSPATYLNEDRYAQVEIPAAADAAAAPEWKRVENEPAVEWHDHRIHWMSTIAPPTVQRAKDQPHHIFDWSVPLRVDGQRVAISGSLDYAPPPTSTFSPILIVPLVTLALIGVLAWWLRTQNTRRSNAETVPPARNRRARAARERVRGKR